MPEKPIHVRVAEALGCEPKPYQFGEVVLDYAFDPIDNWWCHCEHSHGLLSATWHRQIPRYDRDWSAIGPLIEKYGIATMRCPQGRLALLDLRYGHDYPNVDGDSLYCIDEYGLRGYIGSTLLLAVCNLILAETRLPGSKP